MCSKALSTFPRASSLQPRGQGKGRGKGPTETPSWDPSSAQRSVGVEEIQKQQSLCQEHKAAALVPTLDSDKQQHPLQPHKQMIPWDQLAQTG